MVRWPSNSLIHRANEDKNTHAWSETLSAYLYQINFRCLCRVLFPRMLPSPTNDLLYWHHAWFPSPFFFRQQKVRHELRSFQNDEWVVYFIFVVRKEDKKRISDSPSWALFTGVDESIFVSRSDRNKQKEPLKSHPFIAFGIDLSFYLTRWSVFVVYFGLFLQVGLLIFFNLWHSAVGQFDCWQSMYQCEDKKRYSDSHWARLPWRINSNNLIDTDTPGPQIRETRMTIRVLRNLQKR